MNLLTLYQKPEGWPLRSLRIPEAHTVTRGDPRILVGVINIGYSFHSQHEGHLRQNPDPESGGVSGWDFCDDDATLENTPREKNSDYHAGHHSFIVGEVIMRAPACRIMNIRVGQENPESWWRGVDFAVENGAKILITPHGYLSTGSAGGEAPLFYRGTDFSYPEHNPEIRRSLEEAYGKRLPHHKRNCRQPGAACHPDSREGYGPGMVEISGSYKPGNTADTAEHRAKISRPGRLGS